MSLNHFINAKIWKWGDENAYNGEIIDGTIVTDLKTGLITKVDIIDDCHSKNIEPFHESYDLGCNQVILPGLVDAHIHISLLGESQYFVDLSDCYSIDGLTSKLKYHIEHFPDLDWIQGVNWDQTKLGRYPTYKDLDSVVTLKPVFLWRVCWHIGVANSEAMRRAHFDKTLPPSHYKISGGSIDYFDYSMDYNNSYNNDNRNNNDMNNINNINNTNYTSECTGIFRENAVTLISKVFNKNKSKHLKKKFILEGLSLCSQAGLTAVQTNDELCYDIYQELDENQELPIRVYLTPCIQDLNTSIENGGILNVQPFYNHGNNNSSSSSSSNNSSSSSSSSNGNNNNSNKNNGNSTSSSNNTNNNSDTNNNNRMLSMDRVKLFSDGSLGAETAALKLEKAASAAAATTTTIIKSDSKLILNDDDDDDENENDHNNYSGILTYNSKELYNELLAATMRGYRVEVHAIGDAAVHQVLTAMERCNRQLALMSNSVIIGNSACSGSRSSNNSDNTNSIDNLDNSSSSNPHQAYPSSSRKLQQHHNQEPLFLPLRLDRPVLTHCQVLGADLIDRMAALGVIANIQPSFVPTDMRWVSERLSNSQQRHAYAWLTLMQSGVIVAGGSDAPVENCSPFLGLHDAIYRCARKPITITAASLSEGAGKETEVLINSEGGDSNEVTEEITGVDIICSNVQGYNDKEVSSSGASSSSSSLYYPYDVADIYHPQERLSFAQALYLYTLGAAYASKTENILGRLQVGYCADFVVVDEAVVVGEGTRGLCHMKLPNMMVINGKVMYYNDQKISRNRTANIASSSSSSSFLSSNDTSEVSVLLTAPKRSVLTAPTVIMKGPFIPGKNGNFHRKYQFSCACIFLGKDCTGSFFSNND